MNKSSPHDDTPALSAVQPVGGPSDAVVIRRVQPLPIKSNYTLSEFLCAVAASSEPFRRTGDSLVQMYTLVTGDDVKADTRKSIDQWTVALDFATGLVPDVGLSRIPGDAAGIAADSIEGRPVAPERLTGLMQSSDPRNWASRGVIRKKPDFSAMIEQRLRLAAKTRTKDGAPSRTSTIQRDTAHEPPVAEPERLSSERESPLRPGPEIVGTHGDRPSPYDWRIEGEDEFLHGYAQSLAPDRLPSDERHRVVLVDGFHYLRGAAGYYRAIRGQSLDHWLIAAPRGGASAAPVPVHFDPLTGRWRAESPLRLCGGGCGSSREATPDSITLDRDKIRSAVAHLRDDNVREGIRFAFEDLGALHLTRSNRPDLQTLRDNSIIDHRIALRTSMKRIRRDIPLLKQQEEASLITAMHYYWNPYAEAFCQENSEILFHYLLANDIPAKHIRMITVKPKNRPAHVLVLYTESKRLIGLLEAATPQPSLNIGPEGINDMLFAREAYEARDSTVLLDPWSHSRATSFADTHHAVDMVDTLDAAFADIGHRPGSMYWVSITRPLAPRRTSVNSVRSAGSSGSTGGSFSSASGSSGTVQLPGTGVAA